MRLSRKIIYMTSGIVAVMGLVTIVAINGVVKNTIRGSIEQNGVVLAETTVSNVANQYLDGKLLTVKSVLENQLNSNHYLVYAYILNRDDATVVDTFQQGFPAGLVQADPLPKGSSSVTKLLSMNGNLVRDTGVPLVSGFDGIELHIGLSESALLLPLSKISWVIALMTVLGIIIGSLAALILSRLITGPLETLTLQAVQIGEGNLDGEILLNSRDEVGNLARSFNRMTTHLKENIQALQRRNQDLSLLSQKLGEREELLGKLWLKVISAQEEERKRIARELHDETTQSLAAITIGLKTAEEIIPKDQNKGIDFLGQLRNMAGQIVKELHNIVYDLRPTILDDLGLVPALRWYAESRLGTRGIGFDLQAEGITHRFSAEIETTLFRIGQEAISNIFKHAQASKVVLILTEKDNYLTMQVKDDGRGFISNELWNTTDEEVHLGLLGMRERAGLFGGIIEISSQIGNGTVVTVTIELTQTEHSKEDNSFDSTPLG
ncbi:signal transduction histidine kinase [Desulfosporosinus acidiphilus SJ4]|uniref:histidine kinase n=1 Tax=Desulfosporosinus acidiphilus (strain DSM 22704 / JCM 16185 / SJ4) TaxID=646529 RepID=I4D9K8_DESAJ|nr:histidine kinase [Desulfosporosinus acidiphilus]AFM42482.1 signal transduction histidine kinase [Desulfosporosinus acidiphilus SJ4]